MLCFSDGPSKLKHAPFGPHLLCWHSEAHGPYESLRGWWKGALEGGGPRVQTYSYDIVHAGDTMPNVMSTAYTTARHTGKLWRDPKGSHHKETSFLSFLSLVSVWGGGCSWSLLCWSFHSTHHQTNTLSTLNQGSDGWQWCLNQTGKK